jgi:selenocysteine lyase/cysteine desulfurase
MEHHSNDLPWKRTTKVKYIETTLEGELDLNHYLHLMHAYEGKVKLVTITAASNVTGYLTPIHEIAELAHTFGARILVDASQYVPHRLLDMKDNNCSAHIDFVAYTSHKLYAPFGIGVLVGSKEFFNNLEPDSTGGGTVKIVTDDDVKWDETPHKNEAGTPNVIGAVALATAINRVIH